MKKLVLLFVATFFFHDTFSWGFFAHRKINEYAIFLLPPQMMHLYKPNATFISEHAIDPDKRRYAIVEEGPRHYIDLDRYGTYPFDSLPRKWDDAVAKYTEDTLMAHGIGPWWIMVMQSRLTQAFREKNQARILKFSTEIGHYIADAHVPLHAHSNYNGQLTGQKGIHGFWESRAPELLADKEWDFFIGKAIYIDNPLDFIWERVMESSLAADSVLSIEKNLTERFGADRKYAFEERNGKIIRQYSSAFTKAYDAELNGMIERRMRQSIFAIASFWYTAWVNAGQPDLSKLSNKDFSAEELKEFEALENAWLSNHEKGREHE